MQFCLYGRSWDHLSFDDLIALQSETGSLWAHAENSGSESCYVEIARWNERARRHERFAFLKTLDYRFEEAPDASDEETAALAAAKINAAGWGDRVMVVHDMPNWTGPVVQPKTAESEACQ